MNKKWVCNELDLEKVKEIKEKFNLTDLVANICRTRHAVSALTGNARSRSGTR